MKNETKSYVVVEFGPENRSSTEGLEGSVNEGPEMLKVFQYSLELGADGGPVSLKKHQKYEMRADEFKKRIPDIELELGSGYSDWRFRPIQGALGSCGNHIRI